MSHRSDYFGCISRVKILEPTLWLILMLLLVVSQVRLPSILIPTALLESNHDKPEC
jgi:hypothetical protein